MYIIAISNSDLTSAESPISSESWPTGAPEAAHCVLTVGKRMAVVRVARYTVYIQCMLVVVLVIHVSADEAFLPLSCSGRVTTLNRQTILLSIQNYVHCFLPWKYSISDITDVISVTVYSCFQGYVVSLESTLSAHSYNLTRGKESVPGDRDSHVTLTFSAEVRRFNLAGIQVRITTRLA